MSTSENKTESGATNEHVQGDVDRRTVRATMKMLLLRSWLGCLVLLLGVVSHTHASAVAVPRGGGAGPMRKFVEIVKGARKHLVAAAMARSVCIVSMFPADSIKTRVQMQQANPMRLQGIFNGLGGSLVGQVPYGALVFGSYEMYKQALTEHFPNWKPIVTVMASAVLGDLTGSVWVNPSEVVKQKVQAGIFPSTSTAVREIWKKSGIRGFYDGLLGAVTRDIPFRVCQLVSYEALKSVYLRGKARRSTNKKDALTTTLSPIEAAVVGAFAGTVSSAATAPLDRFKTLLMTDSGKYGGSVVSCASKVLQEEGVRGLFTGIVPRVSYIAPSVAIFFVAYEMAKDRLKDWE